MLQPKKYPAFFDLDKTILSINSGSLLVRKAYLDKLMGTGTLLNAILQGYLYKFNLRKTTIIISKMGAWLKGIRVETIDKLADDVHKQYLMNKYRPEIIREIAFHKEKNAAVVILSSSFIQICERVGRDLGFDDIICSHMEYEHGIFTGRPVGNYCFEDEKRIQLLQWCEINKYDPGEAWYYADSVADIPALEAVGHPVCVSPDKKLTRIAQRKGWKILL